jgi:6-phosphofructokinase 1
MEITEYWRPEPVRVPEVVSDDDYREGFLEVLTKAVQSRLRAPSGTVGSMLSGGMDSGSVVAIAKDILASGNEAPLNTFSATKKKHSDCPEARAIQATVKMPSLSPTFVYLEDLGEFAEALISGNEEPFDGDAMLLKALYRAAHIQGQRILLDDHVEGIAGALDAAGGAGAQAIRQLPSLELAGPRQKVFFDPSKTRIGIVTCGGLCPGINDVIRGIVMEAHYGYGVRHIYGFRFGFRGFIPEYGHDYMELTPDAVSVIHEWGGSILGSSRGQQDVGLIVDCLERMNINMLYVIGGDGSLRGSLAIAEEVERRGHKIAVIGVPKTIDNDIAFIDQSFGFETAYSEAVEAIRGAHNEALGTLNGIGLVKVMGRHSGFLAVHAALATAHCNFVFIPEMAWGRNGMDHFLDLLAERLEKRNHAVIVVAEGFAQDFLQDGALATDASGNVKLVDVGPVLADTIKKYLKERNLEHSLKYIDPSYILRSVPARPPDSVYCWRLARNAVHAAMAGKTELVVGQVHGRFVHIPTRRTIEARKEVDLQSDLWMSVLESTDQPAVFGEL